MFSFSHINPGEYTYALPESYIASFPAGERCSSRLLVRDAAGNLQSDHFQNLPSLLKAGSQVVMNNSRVIPARLIFQTPTGSRVELFCLAPVTPAGYEESLASRSSCIWECMAGNLKRFTGDQLEMHLGHGSDSVLLWAEKLNRNGNMVHIRFSWTNQGLTFSDILSLAGKTPLPPYIRREPEETDRERYQTVYSGPGGSVAAPTAGLHFTPGLLDELKNKGIGLHEVTLHVGAGTFQPIRTANVEAHSMHAEFIRVSLSLLRKLRDLSSPVTAVGTTSVRTLESIYWLGVKCLWKSAVSHTEKGLGQWEAYHLPQEVSVSDALTALIGSLENQGTRELVTFTSLMIVPGYRFRMVDTLITNFHQPGSTLLLLVAAFIGPDWKETYRYALDRGYRFLSYGDSSLLFR